MHGNICRVVVQKFSIFFLIGLSSLLESSDWDSLERTFFHHFVCVAVFCFWFVWFSVLKHWKCVGLLGSERKSERTYNASVFEEFFW